MVNLDIKTAKGALEYVSPSLIRRFGNAQLNYNVESLRLDFLLGNFDKAQEFIKTMEHINLETPQRLRWRTEYLFYAYLVKIHSQDIQDVDKIRHQLSEGAIKTKKQKMYVQKHIDYIAAIYEVMVTKQKTDKLSDLIVGTPLDKLMIDYYSAMNDLNQGNEEEAKALFVKIAEMNPDLFYVKEAKRYVDELS